MRSRFKWWAALGLAIIISIGCISTISGGDAVQKADVAATVVATSTSTTIDRELENRQKLEEVKKWNDAVQKANFIAFFNHVAWVTNTNKALEAARAEEAQRQEQKQQQQGQHHSQRGVVPNEPSSGRCGGDLPPCYVMMRESGGSLTARNPSSSASGKWQFLDSTWAGFGGYTSAYLAPESVQDAKARALWAGGAGCSHWNAC